MIPRGGKSSPKGRWLHRAHPTSLGWSVCNGAHYSTRLCCNAPSGVNFPTTWCPTGLAIEISQ